MNEELVMNDKYCNISSIDVIGTYLNTFSTNVNTSINDYYARNEQLYASEAELRGRIGSLEKEVRELKELLRSTTTLVLTLAGNEKIKELKESKLKNE